VKSHISLLPWFLLLVLAVVFGSLWKFTDLRLQQDSQVVDLAAASAAGVPAGFGRIPRVRAIEDSLAISSPAMRDLAASMRRDTAGLERISHPDGRQSVHLQGRFMSMSANVANPSGKAESRCFTHYHELNAASSPVISPPATHHDR